MRLVIQRVSQAKVTVDGREIGNIAQGLCLFLGIAKGDNKQNADYLAQKSAELRIFEDDTGKFNRSLSEIGGEALVVSQFTLYGDCTKGRRPSFSHAAPPDEAEVLYNYFVDQLRDKGIKVGTGQFQAKMEVSIVNTGPVTLILDSK
jgi:D-tyrosyl-tRNA(Tyr) deacylase